MAGGPLNVPAALDRVVKVAEATQSGPDVAAEVRAIATEWRAAVGRDSGGLSQAKMALWTMRDRLIETSTRAAEAGLHRISEALERGVDAAGVEERRTR